MSKEEVRIIQLYSKCLLPVEAELKNHECRQKNALEAMQLLKSRASPRSLKCFACVIIKENWNVDEEVELNTGGCPVKVRNVGSDGDGEPSKKLPMKLWIRFESQPIYRLTRHWLLQKNYAVR